MLNVGSQRQVNVISMEDDEFSTDEEHVSSSRYLHSTIVIICTRLSV